jgi:hypothetical protein
MMTDVKKSRMPLILWSLVWAFALVAAAFLFKGSPASDWIEAAILVGAITCLMWNYERRTCRR